MNINLSLRPARNLVKYILGLTSLCLLTCSCGQASVSSEALKQAESAPLNIDSKNGLKCDREKLLCEAEGSVVVTKGPYVMLSEKASAHMSKSDTGKLEISRVESHDNVRFFGTQGEAAKADDAIYDLPSQLIELKAQKGHQVVVWKDDYIMLSDSVDIHFKKGADNKLQIASIEAKGNVKLSSPDELLEGNRATMTPQDKMVNIYGNVRLNRKEGQLRGPRAQVNLDKKVSKVLKGKDNTSGDRVRVYVYPDKVDKKDVSR